MSESTRKYVENGIVFEEIIGETYRSVHALGGLTKINTQRLDSNTVVDIAYVFNNELSEYIEQSRTERPDPLPLEPGERITQLENESAMLTLELVDTRIRLDDTERRLEQSETEQAALLLELADKGVL
ncbi:hypothetical protein [Cohnella herbarum]|uniref:Uncharacterized protein n=1 Tax=Cohnella herbarum TaxID=2728023 RepID=A0A7Z2ZKZ8_9BACL|nr:hypothetical protein [Cohnella herbarum]QJD83543.1 hypothetical protein HH215_10375 [Cohnella herbarum]